MSGLIFALHDVDERLLLAVLHRRRPRLDFFMRVVTRLGDWYLVVPAALVLASGVAPGLRGAGRVALWSLVISHLFVQALKRRICRPRPAMPVGLRFLIEPEDRFSFPSGHAAAGLSLVLPLALAVGGPVGALLLFGGLAVGVSRCYLGVHFPGDVVVGWTLAALTVAGALAGTAG